jgi:hypothetical protein
VLTVQSILVDAMEKSFCKGTTGPLVIGDENEIANCLVWIGRALQQYFTRKLDSSPVICWIVLQYQKEN